MSAYRVWSIIIFSFLRKEKTPSSIASTLTEAKNQNLLCYVVTLDVATLELA